MSSKFDSAETTLKSLEVDWKKREECLLSLLKQLSAPSSQVMALATISELPKQMAVQFSDLRSGIVKLASETVSATALLAKRVPPTTFLKFSETFLKEPSFFKALGNGNKTIVRLANAAMMHLIAHDCVAFETLESMFHAQKTNKIITIREGIAEALFVYIQGILRAERSNGSTMISTTDVSVKPEDSTAYESGKGGEESSRLELGGARKRLRSAVAKGAENLRVENVGSKRLNPVAKLRLENVKFFEAAAEFLAKDATQNVRNFGKQIRAEVEKLQGALSQVKERRRDAWEAEDSQVVVPPRPPTRPKMVKEKSLNGHGLTLSEAQKSRESMTSKQLTLLEAAASRGPQQFAQLYPPQSFPQSFGPLKPIQDLRPSAPLGERIVHVLKEETLNPRDKSEKLEALISKERGLLPLSLANYVDSIRHFDGVRNVYLRDSVLKILTAADISSYKILLLDYLVEQRLTRKLTFNSVTEYVLQQITFPGMIDVFLSKTAEDYTSLFNRVFDEERFEEMTEGKPELCEKVVTRVLQNVTAQRRKFDDPQFYEAENLRIFEKIMRCRSGIELISRMNLDRMFLGKLQVESPQLYRFIVNSQSQRRGRGDGSTPRKPSLTQSGVKDRAPSVRDVAPVAPHPPVPVPSGREVETDGGGRANFEEVFQKSTPEVRRDLLKSLLPHLNKLAGPNVNAAAKEKIVQKTLEILRLSFDYCLPTEFDTILAALQTIVALLDAGMGEVELMRVRGFVWGVFKRKDIEGQEKILAVLAQLLGRHRSVFQETVEWIEGRATDHERIMAVLTWTKLAVAVRRLGPLSPAIKSLQMLLDRLVTAVKSRMICNPDTLTRKAAVFFMVQVYFLVDQKAFEVLVQGLTNEQRALVMIYVQKDNKPLG